MTNLTIIDTDILIDTSRDKSEAIDYLQNYKQAAIWQLVQLHKWNSLWVAQIK